MKNEFKKIIIDIGEDPTREGLLKTPERAAETFKELTKGYQENLDEILKDACYSSDMSEMIVLKDIEFYSLCEHHLLPFMGKCHVGYIPEGKIIGISRIARIIDFYSRRLQVQEALTQQIAECLLNATKAEGVGVIIEAQHLCLMARGIQKQNSLLKTSVMLGSFRNEAMTRAEFLDLL